MFCKSVNKRNVILVILIKTNLQVNKANVDSLQNECSVYKQNKNYLLRQ